MDRPIAHSANSATFVAGKIFTPDSIRHDKGSRSLVVLYGSQLCIHGGVVASKRFVYVLRSEAQPSRYYTGITSDIAAQLVAHNDGRCTHTASGRPWRLDVVLEFADEARAVRFEKYLKSGSGCAFAKRHFRL